MADKECTVYVVDIGRSMGEKHHGRNITDLAWAMQYVWDKIAAAVSTGRKTLHNGVVALRSNHTNHDGPDEEEYHNISVLMKPQQVLMPDIRRLHDELKPSHTNNGDAISAIIVAIQMITDFCGTKKFQKRIVLITNADGAVEADQIGSIAEKILQEGIQLIVLGIDLDDPEYGYKEEDKDQVKAENEQTLRSLTDKAVGDIGTLKQAVDELQIPEVKVPKPFNDFKGKLRLGDPAAYDSAMEIDVERYTKTRPNAPPQARRVFVKPDASIDSAPTQEEANDPQQEEGDGQLVHQTSVYSVKDDRARDGKRDINRDDLAKGFEYGRSVVHVEPSDESSLKFDTEAGLEIIGFVPRENLLPYMDMSTAHVVIANRTNDLAAMALSSFIHTLYELDNCAIARLVAKQDKSPIIVALTPSIEPDFECLVDVELPFAEDFRQHLFPPLDRIPTVSGKVITQHRLLPNDSLQHAMDDWVKGMDLSEADRDEEGNPTDYLKLDENYSVKLHRLKDAVKFRAIHETDKVPPTPGILTRFSEPPEHLTKKNMDHISKLQEVADVKKVPPKSLSRRNFHGKKAQEAPRSGLDVGALLSERSTANKNRISADNAIPEFKQILADAEDVETIKNSVSQMSGIIRNWVVNSMGDSNYGRATEGIRVMRQECIELEEPGLFNGFLRDLKSQIFEEKLGGDRREMWWQVRSNRLGLIQKDIAPQSEVEEDEARQFMIPDRTRT